jgi:hypothetical protein
MARTNMQIVADGILDDAAAEYLESNLADWHSVDRYATNGCEINLRQIECEMVRGACRAYLASTCPDRRLTLNTYLE